jgi:alpha,alpha-trehalase
MLGQRKQADELYEQLLGYRNDLGLLSEQIDPGTKELMGNFSQALLHIGVLGSAINLARGKVPKEP